MIMSFAANKPTPLRLNPRKTKNSDIDMYESVRLTKANPASSPSILIKYGSRSGAVQNALDVLQVRLAAPGQADAARAAFEQRTVEIRFQHLHAVRNGRR